jgi:hypothetical protein
MSFEKNQIFAQNPYVLAYDFTENHQFMVKTDRNSVFLVQPSYCRSVVQNGPIYEFLCVLKKTQIFAQNPASLHHVEDCGSTKGSHIPLASC